MQKQFFLSVFLYNYYSLFFFMILFVVCFVILQNNNSINIYYFSFRIINPVYDIFNKTFQGRVYNS